MEKHQKEIIAILSRFDIAPDEYLVMLLSAYCMKVGIDAKNEILDTVEHMLGVKDD